MVVRYDLGESERWEVKGGVWKVRVEGWWMGGADERWSLGAGKGDGEVKG